MLVLSRKRDESVVVGACDGSKYTIKVTIVAIRGQKVRLGFEADEGIPVHRSEVWERIHNGGKPDQTSPNIEVGLDQWSDDGGTASRPTRDSAQTA